MSRPKLTLFGPPRLEVNGKAVEISLRKATALLSYLAVTRQPHSRDALATLLWPENNQKSARANLRRIIYDLQKQVGVELLTVSAETIALNSSIHLLLDVEVFKERICSHSQRAAGHIKLAEAADLYVNDFMAGFTLDDCPEYDDWQFFQREELQQSFAKVLVRLIELLEEGKKYDEAVPYARRWQMIDPLHEQAHRKLMELYALTGQQSAAQRQYKECLRILENELGAPPEEETTSLFEAIRTRRFPAVERRRTPQTSTAVANQTRELPLERSARHNLPTQSTPFVGRVQEVDECLRRIMEPACRLLTLIGPGGMGKTRLSLEVALQASSGSDDQAYHFENGIIFVALQPVQTVANIPAAIATALNLQLYDERASRAQVLDYLAERKMLLLLDNFEHLLDGVDLLVDILKAAPDVKLLVTSRAALPLQEAWFHPVAGMFFPSLKEPKDTSEDAYDAVRLFDQCAQRAQLHFSLENEYETVVRICQLVDGMPLALELAAAWLKVLSPIDVVKEIEQGIDILTSRHRNVPERHRSVRAVLMQSWERLTEDEQGVLTKLSVFQGGCDRDAAQQVAGATMPILASLIDKAFLQRTSSNRYQLHELLRQYSAEQLSTISEQELQTYEHFSRYYLTFIADRGVELDTNTQQRCLDEFDQEADNIEASWRWACQNARLDLVSMALDALYHFHQLRSRYIEGQLLLAEAIQTLDSPIEACSEVVDLISLRHKVKARWAALGTSLGDYEEARAVLQLCLDAAGQRQDQREMAFCYEYLGETERCVGRMTEAIGLFEQFLEVGKAIDDEHITSAALLYLGNALIFESRHFEAKETLLESLSIYRRLERPDRIAHVLDKLGYVSYCIGEYDDSEHFYDESLRIFRALGDKFGISAAAGGSALLLTYVIDRRQLDKAQELVEESIRLSRETGRREHLALMLISMADIQMLRCNYDLAEEHYRESLAISVDLGYMAGLAEGYVHLGELYLLQGVWKPAKRNLCRGLQAALDAHFFQYVTYALIRFAQLVTDSPYYQQEEDQIAALDYLAIAQKQLPENTLVRYGVEETKAKITTALADKATIEKREPPPELEALAADALERFR